MVPKFLDENIRHIRELIEGSYRIIYKIKSKSVEVLRILLVVEMTPTKS